MRNALFNTIREMVTNEPLFESLNKTSIEN